MRAYLSLFRIRFISSIQYRAAALAGISTQFAWGFMLIFSYKAFYRSNPGAFSMDFSHLVSYIWLQQAFLNLFVNWIRDNDIIGAIRDGNISYELARPVGLYGKWYMQIAANRVARTLLRCFPLLIVAFILPEPIGLRLPPDLIHAAGFLASMLLALGVTTAYVLLVYSTAILTLSPYGLWVILMMLGDFLSGQLIPLTFFPGAARRVAELLPFAAMQNMPLRIYTGNITGTGILYGISFQCFWLLTLVTLGCLVMKKALTRVTVQGG